MLARGVRKSFGDIEALRGADLRLDAGKVVALLGPSGCGKTTLLRCIAGLEAVDAGEVVVAGVVVDDGVRFVAPQRRRVGMVFQEWALFPHMTVGRNVAFGLPRGERRGRRVDEALALVDLAGYAGRAPSTLSGGQQQRVALARALANNPAVILLDEPFSNLDAALRAQIRVEVQRVLKRLGVSAVFVTHQQEEAFVVGDEVAVMLDGVVVQQAPPAEIYAAPVSRAVAEFVGDANFLPGSAHGDKVEIDFGAVPLRDDEWGQVDVLVRPEHISLFEGDDATVEGVSFHGHDSIYALRTSQRREVLVRVIAAPQFRVGDRVGLLYTGPPTVAYRKGP